MGLPLTMLKKNDIIQANIMLFHPIQPIERDPERDLERNLWLNLVFSMAIIQFKHHQGLLLNKICKTPWKMHQI